jgi:hypothetical protein
MVAGLRTGIRTRDFSRIRKESANHSTDKLCWSYRWLAKRTKHDDGALMSRYDFISLILIRFINTFDFACHGVELLYMRVLDSNVTAANNEILVWVDVGHACDEVPVLWLYKAGFRSVLPAGLVKAFTAFLHFRTSCGIEQFLPKGKFSTCLYSWWFISFVYL